MECTSHNNAVLYCNAARFFAFDSRKSWRRASKLRFDRLLRGNSVSRLFTNSDFHGLMFAIWPTTVESLKPSALGMEFYPFNYIIHKYVALEIGTNGLLICKIRPEKENRTGSRRL